MNLKNIFIILSILLLICLSLGAVSGTDNINDSNLKNDVNANDIGTFRDLNGKIISSENYVILDSDYKFNNSDDEEFKNGIIISKDNFVLDGNGFTIDGSNLARGFNITGRNITIKNLNFNGCWSYYVLGYSDGGAIYNFNGHLTVSNCSFINCNGYNGDGGAIYNWNANCTVSNCSFINCMSSDDGGALHNDLNSVMNVSNCNFINCNATSGGAIGNVLNSVMNVSNCNFSNCSSYSSSFSTSSGGAIYNGGNLTVSNCNFINCSAYNSYSYFYSKGGAIYNIGGYLTVSSCNFINCKCSSDGSAIYSTISFNCSDCIFDNCIGRSVIELIKNSFNLDGNYWGGNYRDSTEFSNDHLIYYNGYIAPNNWILMNITGPDKIGAGENVSFNITLNTLTDGITNSTYTGFLHDYKVVISEDSSKGSVNVNIINGIGSFDYTVPSNPGNFTLVVTSALTGKQLFNKTFSSEAIVKDVDVNITASNVTYGAGSPIDGVTVNIYEANTSILVGNKTNVTFVIYNAVGDIVDNNTWDNLSAGNYQIMAIYVGLIGVYNRANSTRVNFTVNKANLTDIDVSVNPKVIVYGENTTVTVNVNPTTVSGNVTLYVDGVYYDTVDLKGIYGGLGPQASEPLFCSATFNLENLTGGVHNISAVYNGNENYTNKSKTVNITVDKLGTNIFASDITFSAYSTKEFTITLKDAKGNVLAGKNVNVNFNGKTYTLTTNNVGVAKINLKSTVAKTYIATVTFAGDDNYIGSSKKVNVVVKPIYVTVKQIMNAANTLMNYAKKNKKLPVSIKIGSVKCTMGQASYLMSAAIKSFSAKIKVIDVKATIKNTKGEIKSLKKVYPKIVKNIYNKGVKGNLPTTISVNGKNVGFNQYTFALSKILTFYQSKHRLPNYVVFSGKYKVYTKGL